MIDENTLSRRAFLKGAAAAAALVPMGALLSACAGGEPEQADQPEPEQTPESAEQPAASAEPADTTASGALVAYFSATGNTRAVAEKIAAHLSADTFEITPAEPYSDEDLNYNSNDSRTSQERNDPARHVELTQVTPEGFDAYDTVFVGYPIWWGEASWAITDFIIENDFSGKRVIPFCTSGSSPIGSSGENLAGLAGAGDWLEGERFSGSASEEEVAAWVGGLGL